VSVEVLVFRSRRAVYGVMASQVAGLSRRVHSLDTEAVSLVQAVERRSVEDCTAIGERLFGQCAPLQDGVEYLILDRDGFGFWILGPIELRTIALEDFRPIPTVISRCYSNEALRAVFLLDDCIGFLVDLSRMRTSIPGNPLA